MTINKGNINIIFMGTPSFAVPSLQKLVKSGYNISAVVTQPDRPQGRGQKVVFSPIKQVATDLELNVLQPLKIREEGFLEALANLQPDFIIVVAFGKILTKAILDLPRYACINVHASLLPRYRGAAPIHRAILNGEKETGVTTMLMDAGLDTGDMLLAEKMKIANEMNYGDLHDNLAEMGANLLLKTLDAWLMGEIKPIQQDEAQASYAKMIQKEDEIIHWDEDSVRIINRIRALDPWPGVYTYYNRMPLKIREIKLWEHQEQSTQPGTILEIIKGEGFVVQTGKGGVVVTKVQPAGKSVMSAHSFVNGYKLKKGYVFNDE